MVRTLADMTPDERQSCVGMWAEWIYGDGQMVLVVIEEVHPVRDYAGCVVPGVRYVEIPRHQLSALFPRHDLPRAWMPDGRPVEMEVEVSEVEYGRVRVYEVMSHDRVDFPEDTKVRRFVGEWEATDD